MLNTNSHRIAFVASSLSDQDPEEAFAPTSFSSEIWNSKPSTTYSETGSTAAKTKASRSARLIDSKTLESKVSSFTGEDTSVVTYVYVLAEGSGEAGALGSGSERFGYVVSGKPWSSGGLGYTGSIG
jgi:hypothetical protein